MTETETVTMSRHNYDELVREARLSKTVITEVGPPKSIRDQLTVRQRERILNAWKCLSDHSESYGVWTVFDDALLEVGFTQSELDAWTS